MFDALSCEIFAEAVCPTVGGTVNADFCKAGGPGCDHALVVPGIDGKRCSSDSDCDGCFGPCGGGAIPGLPGIPGTTKKVCCSAYEKIFKAACTGIDSAKLEEAVTITVPSRA